MGQRILRMSDVFLTTIFGDCAGIAWRVKANPLPADARVVRVFMEGERYVSLVMESALWPGDVAPGEPIPRLEPEPTFETVYPVAVDPDATTRLGPSPILPIFRRAVEAVKAKVVTDAFDAERSGEATPEQRDLLDRIGTSVVAAIEDVDAKAEIAPLSPAAIDALLAPHRRFEDTLPGPECAPVIIRDGVAIEPITGLESVRFEDGPWQGNGVLVVGMPGIDTHAGIRYADTGRRTAGMGRRIFAVQVVAKAEAPADPFAKDWSEPATTENDAPAEPEPKRINFRQFT